MRLSITQLQNHEKYPLNRVFPIKNSEYENSRIHYNFLVSLYIINLVLEKL